MSAKMQYCTSSVFGFESSRDPRVIYVKERIIEIPPCTCFFSSQSRKILHGRERNAGGCGGGVRERGVGDWQAVHTRAICTTTIMRIRPRRVPTPVSIERKRTFAVRALGQWCARPEETARIPPFSLPRIKVAEFLIRARMQTGPVAERWQFQIKSYFSPRKKDFKRFNRRFKRYPCNVFFTAKSVPLPLIRV